MNLVTNVLVVVADHLGVSNISGGPGMMQDLMPCLGRILERRFTMMLQLPEGKQLTLAAMRFIWHFRNVAWNLLQQ